MKKLTSIIIVLVLLVSMFTVATGAQTVPLAASNDSEYLISEYTKENADKVSGAIHGYMGDCDGDTDISIMDATEIQLAVAQFITLDEIRSMLADVDCDGDVSIIDATEIQLYVAQLSTSDVIGHILYTPVVEFDPEKYAYVKVDDEYYLVTGEDKTFTYTAYLASDAKISSLDASVMYDSSGIEFLPNIDEDGYYTDYEYPNLKSPVYTDIGGQINYNFAYYKGINFPLPEYGDMDYDNILFTGQFKVTADTGVYEISHIIKVLGGAPNYKIIYNYEKVNDEVTVITDNELTGLYLIDNSLIPTEPVPTESPMPTDSPEPTEAPLPTEERPTEYHPDYPTNAVIHFDANTTGWNNYKAIFFHIWAYGGDSFYAWSSKAERGNDSDGDGVWTYDLNAKGIYLEPGTQYAVIFFADTGIQTHDLLFDSSVIGDTAYVNPNIMYENIADSNKSSVAAFWQGQDPTVFGPVKGITSIGNVVGTCVPSTTTPYRMFVDFLENILENARTYSGKDDQQLIDDTAKQLGLYKLDVMEAIAYAGVSVAWSASKSPLKDGNNYPDYPYEPDDPYYPDYPDYPEASPDQPDYPDYPYDFPYYPRTSGNTISFDANTTGWNNYKYIGFHIWEYGGDAFYNWGSKGQRGTDSDGDNIWTYDLDAKGITLRPNTLYAVIFYNDWMAQTYDLLFTTDCIGDTAFCADVSLENPWDSSKTSQAAFWSRKDPTVLGPVKEITSIGNVVGTCIPSTTSAQAMFEDFLENTLENARTYSGKSDQRILDDVAYLLGLKASDVQKAIKNTGVRVSWSASNSYLDGAESDSPVNPTSPSQAFDAIKKYLNNNPVWEYDYGIDYEVELSYNSGNNSIIISGVDYSSTRVVRTYIRIMRGDRVFYYETEMDNDVTGAVYFDATGYGSIASTKPLSFYTERATFSSSSYTYSQAEPIITDGFAKALAVADYALGGSVNCSIYDLL